MRAEVKHGVHVEAFNTFNQMLLATEGRSPGLISGAEHYFPTIAFTAGKNLQWNS